MVHKMVPKWSPKTGHLDANWTPGYKGCPLQQNIQQVYNGNEDAIIAEAERRHKEIMGQWLDMVKTKFRQAIDEVASKHHEEISSVKHQAQSSYNQVLLEREFSS